MCLSVCLIHSGLYTPCLACVCVAYSIYVPISNTSECETLGGGPELLAAVHSMQQAVC